MDREEVVKLMESSNSDEEWNRNADIVKSKCGGYPPFWWEAIMLSGVADRTTAKWGGDAKLHIVSL